MKSTLSILSLVAVVSFVGCTESQISEADPSSEVQATEVSQALGENELLVSLKVPNMHCDACAASVRGDLREIVGVKDVKTDVDGRTATFVVTDKQVDVKAELAAIAENNEHIAEYEIQ